MNVKMRNSQFEKSASEPAADPSASPLNILQPLEDLKKKDFNSTTLLSISATALSHLYEIHRILLQDIRLLTFDTLTRTRTGRDLLQLTHSIN